MTTDPEPPEKLSLRRWSQRKLDASRAVPAPVVAAPSAAPLPVEPAASSADVPAPDVPAASALPPVESLTPESDFAAYLSPAVDEALKRQALRKLFSDPRFNVMDGLDVYVDDYTKTIPVPASLLERLSPMHGVFDVAPAVPETDPKGSEATAEAPGVTPDPAAPVDAKLPPSDAATPLPAEPADEPPPAPDAEAPGRS